MGLLSAAEAFVGARRERADVASVGQGGEDQGRPADADEPLPV